MFDGKKLSINRYRQRSRERTHRVGIDRLLSVVVRRVRREVGSVLDNSDLVAVASEEASKLEVVHRSRDRSLGDLEAVDVKNREDGSRLGRVEVLVCVPGSGGGTCMDTEGREGKRSSQPDERKESKTIRRTGLALSITDDSNRNSIGSVHNGSVGDSEGISEL